MNPIIIPVNNIDCKPRYIKNTDIIIETKPALKKLASQPKVGDKVKSKTTNIIKFIPLQNNPAV